MKQSNTMLLQQLNAVRTEQKTGFVSLESFIKFIELKNEKKAKILEQIKFNIQNN